MKQRAVQLYEEVHELKERRDRMIAEDKNMESPQEERERLLKQARTENIVMWKILQVSIIRGDNTWKYLSMNFAFICAPGSTNNLTSKVVNELEGWDISGSAKIWRPVVVSSDEGCEDNPRAGAPLLWRQDERIGAVHPEGEKPLERSYSKVQYLKRAYKKEGKWLFYIGRK